MRKRTCFSRKALARGKRIPVRRSSSPCCAYRSPRPCNGCIPGASRTPCPWPVCWRLQRHGHREARRMPERLVAVVEDEAALRDNYVAALRHRGYRARGYAGRAEALAAFERALPDLVLIDINLGAEIEGGFELC